MFTTYLGVLEDGHAGRDRVAHVGANVKRVDTASRRRVHVDEVVEHAHNAVHERVRVRLRRRAGLLAGHEAVQVGAVQVVALRAQEPGRVGDRHGHDRAAQRAA